MMEFSPGKSSKTAPPPPARILLSAYHGLKIWVMRSIIPGHQNCGNQATIPIIGSVMVSHYKSNITFQEEGQWQDRMNYRNAFRWTWNREKAILSLEHLRFGEKNPVFLFHLVPSGKYLLKSLNPHLCGDDTYFGSLHYNELFLKMHIRTIGPKKNESVDYIYT